MSDSTQMLDNEEIILITSKLLLIAPFSKYLDGIQVVVLGALRGLQDVKIPMYITLYVLGYSLFPII
jgi:MATE family multidrug resistance protein